MGRRGRSHLATIFAAGASSQIKRNLKLYPKGPKVHGTSAPKMLLLLRRLKFDADQGKLLLLPPPSQISSSSPE
jgi:hypothetical protein